MGDRLCSIREAAIQSNTVLMYDLCEVTSCLLFCLKDDLESQMNVDIRKPCKLRSEPPSHYDNPRKHKQRLEDKLTGEAWERFRTFISSFVFAVKVVHKELRGLVQTFNHPPFPSLPK